MGIGIFCVDCLLIAYHNSPFRSGQRLEGADVRDIHTDRKKAQLDFSRGLFAYAFLHVSFAWMMVSRQFSSPTFRPPRVRQADAEQHEVLRGYESPS